MLPFGIIYSCSGGGKNLLSFGGQLPGKPEHCRGFSSCPYQTNHLFFLKLNIYQAIQVIHFLPSKCTIGVSTAFTVLTKSPVTHFCNILSGQDLPCKNPWEYKIKDGNFMIHPAGRYAQNGNIIPISKHEHCSGKHR